MAFSDSFLAFMTATLPVCRHPLAARCALFTPVLAALALTTGTASQAQTHACELLKSSLAARMPPAIHGYSMEALPASTPVPPGSKVIGNCEAGAYKVVYRRFSSPAEAASAAGAQAAGATPELPAAPAPRVPPRPPATASAAATPQRALPAASAAPTSEPASAPVPAPRAKFIPPTPTVAVISAATVASEPAVGREHLTPPPESSPASPQAAPALPPDATLPDHPGFLASNWPWLAAVLLLPLIAALWAWFSHHRAYDAAGLPRGPKLN